MTPLRQIELNCQICSNAFISGAVRFGLGGGVGREERALLTYEASDRRVTRTQPAENHSYNRCA
jgi:hypothetical protein